MDTRKITLIINMILETIDETEGGPESHFYIPMNSLGINLDQFLVLMGVLKNLKAIDIKSHWVSKGQNFDSVFKNIKEAL